MHYQKLTFSVVVPAPSSAQRVLSACSPRLASSRIWKGRGQGCQHKWGLVMQLIFQGTLVRAPAPIRAQDLTREGRPDLTCGTALLTRTPCERICCEPSGKDNIHTHTLHTLATPHMSINLSNQASVTGAPCSKKRKARVERERPDRLTAPAN